MIRILLCILLLCCLPGCVPAAASTGQPAKPALEIFTPSPEPPPTRVLVTHTPTTTASPTSTRAAPTQTPTATATVLPTAAESPTPQPTYDTLRRTPPTLMLHMSNPDFDSVAFVKGMVRILKERGFRAVTYLDLFNQPDLTAAEQGRLFIFTIDDISLQAKIDPSILEMIAVLREAGYPAVLGIVTEGKLADTETAATLKALAAEGWELAMHTENHTDLHLLEQTSPYGARLEIRTCSDKIFTATGVKPITLVLPYGSMVQDLKILYRENVRWVVGIVGGEKYRTTNHVYYVGREGPSGDSDYIFQVMMTRFNS